MEKFNGNDTITGLKVLNTYTNEEYFVMDSDKNNSLVNLYTLRAYGFRCDKTIGSETLNSDYEVVARFEY